MKRVFISIPMNGKTCQDIQEEMMQLTLKAEKQLGDDVILLQSIFELEENTSPIVYLARSIEKMASADVVFLARDWEKARGCIIEHLVAKLYDKEIVYED